jgi:hypothetical protein
VSTSDWGPSHPCPFCDVEVQLYKGPRDDYPHPYLAGTWERHRCPKAAEQIPDTHRCECGVVVERYRGSRQKYDYGALHEHACRQGDEGNSARPLQGNRCAVPMEDRPKSAPTPHTGPELPPAARPTQPRPRTVAL